MVDFIFNGKYIIGTDRLSFPTDYNACSGEKNYQRPKFQHMVDKGPLPEAEYGFKINVPKIAIVNTSTNIYTCEPKPSYFLQKMPTYEEVTKRLGNLGFQVPTNPENCNKRLAEFGRNRVKLSPDPIGRSGFYIHDSKLGETNGCIEVESAFFDDIYKYQQKTLEKRLIIRVKYLNTEMITNYNEAASTGQTAHLYKTK